MVDDLRLDVIRDKVDVTRLCTFTFDPVPLISQNVFGALCLQLNAPQSC